ncbi:MAG: DNA polymerase III subunit delta [Clostridiales bacterium]|nr:DNA polymerase III subunit delta [Clostridiales bacterium]
MSNFSDIIGHEAIIANLRKAVLNNRLSHAYILDGAAGMGKNMIAGALAKTVQCENKVNLKYPDDRPDNRPDNCPDACGTCVSCRAFESGNHPDIIYVTTTKKSIGVDEIREQVTHAMLTRPYKYKYKIFIIDNADTMTTQAQNALLKTIEEPAEYGLFLLLSENLSVFLPTVLSRCVSFRLRPLPSELVKSYLVENGTDRELAGFYTAFSQGNIGRAAKLASSESFYAMRDTVVSLAQAIRRLDMPETFSRFSVLEPYKDNIQELLDLFLLWYRDVILYKETSAARLIIQTDKADEIYAEAQATPMGSLYNKFDAIWQAKRNLKSNANFQLTLEMMLLELR